MGARIANRAGKQLRKIDDNLNLPLAGQPVQLENKLKEIHNHNDRMEMVN